MSNRSPTNQTKRTPVNNVRIAGRIGMMVNPPTADQDTVFNTGRTIPLSAQPSHQTASPSPLSRTNRTSGSGHRQGDSAARGDRLVEKDMMVMKYEKVTEFLEEMMGTEAAELMVVDPNTEGAELNFVELNERVAEECEVPYPEGLSDLVIVKGSELEDLLAENARLMAENKRMNDVLRRTEIN